MTAAFHFLTSSGNLSTDYGGIIPPPITLTGAEAYVDGHLTTISAVSGTQHYFIVEPGDFPLTEDERYKRSTGFRNS